MRLLRASWEGTARMRLASDAAPLPERDLAWVGLDRLLLPLLAGVAVAEAEGVAVAEELYGLEREEE